MAPALFPLALSAPAPRAEQKKNFPTIDALSHKLVDERFGPERRAARRLKECAAFYHVPFEPVPVKARHDGWTAERQRGFIDRLVVTGCVSRSARAVGMTPQSARSLRTRKGAASFSRAWDQALESGRSYQIDVGLERSVLGERRPILRKGRVVGETVRFDNRLTMVVLNALDRRPRRWRDRHVAEIVARFCGDGPAGEAGAAERPVKK